MNNFQLLVSGFCHKFSTLAIEAFKSNLHTYRKAPFFGCMDEVSVQHTSWKNNARANDHGEGIEEFESAL